MSATASKRVVSVSLGSSRRDHTAFLDLLGERIEVSRRGFDGDVDAAERAVAELDGRVDAIGLGGLDVYLYIAGDRYVVADGERLLRAARRTPVVDGSGLKRTLEPRAVRWLAGHGPLPFAGLKVLMVSALDRYGMAVALEEAGCRVTYGDLMFGPGIPYPIRSLEELRTIARRLAREMVKLPIRMLYPTGSAQEAPPEARFPEAYAEADLVAGDFHYIRRYMPERLDGKAILTNTTTADDRRELRRRGVRWLFTTTPLVGGRSFGTNVLEAALIAASGRRPEELDEAGYESFLDRIGYRPVVLDLAAEEEGADADGRRG
ncbi:MAG: quinate 5-dehydrogenase [Bacillota bacterium]|nr:quinate 5-dehydrogenase [Bacillota bacterium]